MKKKNQIVDLTYNLKTQTTNGARDEDLAMRKYFWCLENLEEMIKFVKEGKEC